jgi:S1-C subfamily serine protease
MKHSIRLIILVSLLSCIITLVAVRLIPGFAEQEKPAPVLASSASGAIPLSSDEEVNFRVYNKVSPGVVNITRMVVELDWYLQPYATEGGSGSGCVLDTDGNILTNFHVVQSSESLEVSLPDHSKYHAKVVGSDRQNDLAVIKIDAPKEKLHPIVFGDSNIMRIGQKVLVIGNPLGLQNTLTTGIVSSTGRRIKTESGDLVDNVIQTDAAINPGNSGGPLLNTAGELIGINSSIFTIGGGNIGIGFAIPASTAKRVASELIQYGRVLRPWFGVDQGYTIDDDLAATLKLPVRKGILVVQVRKGSSADKAGIQGATEAITLFFNQRILLGGDIITEIDGKPVESLSELRLELEGKKPGEIVKATIYRGKNKLQKEITLIETPAPRQTTF